MHVKAWPLLSLAALAVCLFVANAVLLASLDVRARAARVVVRPQRPLRQATVVEEHPIAALTQSQLVKFKHYQWSQSVSFSRVVAKYRRKYGRHPPPRFDEWYMFARERRCVNFDDFDQIMDDLRPFWGIPPAKIRATVRAMDTPDSKVSILRPDAWRHVVFKNMLATIVQYLPDLDIAMNTLDEPRVVVPWQEVQKMLAIEQRNRIQPPKSVNEFTKINLDAEPKKKVELGFFSHSGKPYMDIASKACPPDSFARRPELDTREVESSYKEPIGGFIHDFNRSTDLCTVGPKLDRLHGFLFSSSTTIPSQKLIPIFSECKVNVNNDILFPANKYYDTDDKRYAYNGSSDTPWHEKVDQMAWRGVTSGGVQLEETYMNLHRHRFVAMTNATKLGNHTTFTIMEATDDGRPANGYAEATFHPAGFAAAKTDVAFSEVVWCVPDCHFLDDKLTPRPGLAFKDTFRFKYLADIDGHSFSGRWHAFLKSRSMGLKATIFKEWHDQRLFEWVHFAPMDNRFDDLYALLTYFMGLEKKSASSDGVRMPRHDTEAKRIADRGREWAAQVLRKEDIEIYMLRLMLEYARIVDDNRDSIGYSGDGSEVDSGNGRWGRHWRQNREHR
ncbi:hypothetical protein DRE_01816 [Drechslerella stenobrocha 248]|uniref:Glycosyl transferase CAP10 domain-containing protein n=1 Tax=Drechslerella stenobrocha 248 TaxID=1043628 RepID=W7HYM3_9PEZI|nr:hypothetical protein DRE_01816 [Drechslerella stenobrocha 248]